MTIYFNILKRLFFIYIAVLPLSVNAQDNVQLINLETVLKIGGANNLTIQEFKLRQQLAFAELKEAKEWWLPTIYTGTTFHQLWGNAMNGNGEFFTDVNRQNFWGGVGLNASWNFGEGIYKTKAIEFKMQSTALNTQAAQNKLLLHIISTYYDFLSAQLFHKAYTQLADQADTIATQIGVQVESGIGFESEMLLARSNYNHLKVKSISAQIDYSDKTAQLVRLLNLEPGVKLLASDSIIAPLNLIALSDLNELNDSVSYSRAEIKSLEFSLLALNQQKKTTTTGLFLPELRIGSYGSYFGDIFTPINLTGELNAALVWKIPIGRITSGGTVLKYNAKIDLQKNKIEQTKAHINEEVLRAKERIILADQQFKVAEQGLSLSSKALKQCIDRQSLGNVRPMEIIHAQEMHINSMLDYLKAVTFYNKAQYAYYVATGNNL